jgi:hypothetical protein
VREDGRLCRVVSLDSAPSSVEQAIAEVSLSPGRALAYSAIVPGATQRILGQERWIAYIALEAWGWVQFFDRRNRGKDLQERYRDLAWDVARRISQGPRVDGDFEYYEALTKFEASGAFDRDPQRTGIQPETDTTTFNGSIWKLARDIFFPAEGNGIPAEDTPEYARAIGYYRERSYAARFAWNWGGNTLQQATFVDLIADSDENLRRSTTMIGLLIANHLISAVDGVISTRLRAMGRESEELEIVVTPLEPAGAWAIQVRIPR